MGQEVEVNTMKPIILLFLLLTACGPAKASNVNVQRHDATDGTRCYILEQDGNARGLSCL